ERAQDQAEFDGASCHGSSLRSSSVETGPVAIIEYDLNVIDRVEVHAGLFPDSEHEVAVQRTAAELLAQVLIDELAIRRPDGVRQIALRRKAARVLDHASEEVGLEIA